MRRPPARLSDWINAMFYLALIWLMLTGRIETKECGDLLRLWRPNSDGAPQHLNDPMQISGSSRQLLKEPGETQSGDQSRGHPSRDSDQRACDQRFREQDRNEHASKDGENDLYSLFQLFALHA